MVLPEMTELPACMLTARPRLFRNTVLTTWAPLPTRLGLLMMLLKGIVGKGHDVSVICAAGRDPPGQHAMPVEQRQAAQAPAAATGHDARP